MEVKLPPSGRMVTGPEPVMLSAVLVKLAEESPTVPTSWPTSKVRPVPVAIEVDSR